MLHAYQDETGNLLKISLLMSCFYFDCSQMATGQREFLCPINPRYIRQHPPQHSVSLVCRMDLSAFNGLWATRKYPHEPRVLLSPPTHPVWIRTLLTRVKLHHCQNKVPSKTSQRQMCPRPTQSQQKHHRNKQSRKSHRVGKIQKWENKAEMCRCLCF